MEASSSRHESRLSSLEDLETTHPRSITSGLSERFEIMAQKQARYARSMEEVVRAMVEDAATIQGQTQASSHHTVILKQLIPLLLMPSNPATPSSNRPPGSNRNPKLASPSTTLLSLSLVSDGSLHLSDLSEFCSHDRLKVYLWRITKSTLATPGRPS